jgi:hypothetical protein
MHWLAPGETLRDLAKIYKTPVSMLISLNKITDVKKMYVGMQLFVKQYREASLGDAYPETWTEEEKLWVRLLGMIPDKVTMNWATKRKMDVSSSAVSGTNLNATKAPTVDGRNLSGNSNGVQFFTKDDEARFEMASGIHDLEVKKADALTFLNSDFKSTFDLTVQMSAKNPRTVADEIYDMTKTQAFQDICASMSEGTVFSE